MDQITNWMQSNWYELGSLVAQFTFLFAGLWFAQKILKTLRASQQQVGALLRLSMADGLQEPSNTSETAHEGMNEPANEPTPSVVAGSMFGSAPEHAASHAAFEKPARTEKPSLSSELSGRARTSAAIASEPMTSASIVSVQDPTPYVAAPLTLPEGEDNGGHLAAAGRGVVQWLQAPMVKKQNSGSPLKKVVRWLQAPARS